MQSNNRTLAVALVIVALLIGGGIAYALNQPNDAADSIDNREAARDEVTGTQPDQTQAPDSSTNDTPATSSASMPDNVRADIARDYPDYVIDDIDREIRDGQVVYEVELEHRNRDNESEYELLYDENWQLIRADFDRD